ncbi:aldehyde dehydrogenase family protein [Actinacidiphila oryziradicis]|uniref:aldehyde dehydrogenase family protein n=1 Tax=Actinacidiphila oryziradicis TaxID=2571141 RepID=UPI001FE28CFC|nr:aldehyde dehydrogenase family protein [Actinacidiphila oryziradicis]
MERPHGAHGGQCRPGARGRQHSCTQAVRGGAAGADLDAAVPAIVASVTENAGQNCYAGSRLLVEASVQDEVVARVAEAMRGVRLGAWHQDLDMGPLVSEAQYRRVLGFLTEAPRAGARQEKAVAVRLLDSRDPD